MKASDRQVGVYSLRFSNGEIYIGASSNIKSRIQTHLSWLRKGKGQTKELQTCFDTHGVPDTVTELVCSAENLAMYEGVLFDYYQPSLCKKQYGGNVGIKLKPETIAKMRESAKNKDQMCQSARQLETWSDPEIRARRVEGMKQSWNKRKQEKSNVG